MATLFLTNFHDKTGSGFGSRRIVRTPQNKCLTLPLMQDFMLRKHLCSK